MCSAMGSIGSSKLHTTLQNRLVVSKGVISTWVDSVHMLKLILINYPRYLDSSLKASAICPINEFMD